MSRSDRGGGQDTAYNAITSRIALFPRMNRLLGATIQAMITMEGQVYALHAPWRRQEGFGCL